MRRHGDQCARRSRIVCGFGGGNAINRTNTEVLGRLAALAFAFRSLLPGALKDVPPQIDANSTAALRAYAVAGHGAAVMPELTVAWDAATGDLAVIAREGAELTETRMSLCRTRSLTMGHAANRLLTGFAQSFSEDCLAAVD